MYNFKASENYQLNTRKAHAEIGKDATDLIKAIDAFIAKDPQYNTQHDFYKWEGWRGFATLRDARIIYSYGEWGASWICLDVKKLVEMGLAKKLFETEYEKRQKEFWAKHNVQ